MASPMAIRTIPVQRRAKLSVACKFSRSRPGIHPATLPGTRTVKSSVFRIAPQLRTAVVWSEATSASITRRTKRLSPSCTMWLASTAARSSECAHPAGNVRLPSYSPKNQVEPRPSADGTFLSGEEDGEDRKDSRPQEGHGHQQIHCLPQVRQGYAHREADQGPRTGCPGRDLYFLLRVRILRKTLGAADRWLLPFSDFPVPELTERRDLVAPVLS